MTRPGQVVVVGGGLAGLRTVEELRGRGYGGQVTLVGAEPRLPYDRPPLSKKLMTGALDDTTLRHDLDLLQAEVRLAERAVSLDDGVLTTDRGEHAFDALVLATGATPVMLPGDGRQRVLRTIEDALELRELLRPGVTLAIVGAGWIGAELATAAVRLGCQVTVLEAAQTPLAAAVGPEVGRLTAQWYAAAGVDLRLGQGVESVRPGGLALAGGGWLAADVIVTAVGVRPAVSWLADSAVALDNGVAVDARLRTSAAGVFAVGDCAAFESLRYGRRLRFEHWDVALHAPEVVAANILGGSEAYDPVPYFWSEQFGRMVQYVGHLDTAGRGAGGDGASSDGNGERLVWRGDPSGERWAAAWLAGGRLVALLTVGLPRDLLQGRRLISSGLPVDPGRLADPQSPLRDSVLT
jgi:3-phenylpropionate/trans-cinnamate dioxygenase ferredoxin reductase component